MNYGVSISILVFFFVVSFQSIAQADEAFTVDLIHRDSPQSPFYNRSISQSELLEKEMVRSRSRVYNLNLSSTYKEEKSTVFAHHQERKLLASEMIRLVGGDYLTNYYFGSEKVQVKLFVDPASDFVWTECDPDKELRDVYNPSVSSSYVKVLSNSNDCQYIPFRTPEETSGLCSYKYDYIKRNLKTEGVVVIDNIYFGPSQEDSSKVLFGCAKTIKLADEAIGVVGLGRGPLSLVSQQLERVTYKFSYCLQPLNEGGINKLKFGNLDEEIEQNLKAAASPLQLIDTSSYYLYLQSIQIGDDIKIHTPLHLIKIDFGQSMTYLQQTVYQQLEEKLNEIVRLEQTPSSKFNLCYNKDDVDVRTFPGVVFHFEGAFVTLEPLNMLVVHEGRYCMAIHPLESHGGHSVFGSRAQVNHVMQFDLASGTQYVHGTVSIAQMDCNLFNSGNAV